MDPPALMNQGSYNLSEIWPFPINSAGEVSGGGLKLRMPHFGEISSNNDPMSIDHVAAPHPRKRRDEDSCAKGVSSSSGNGNGNGVVSDCEGKRLKSDGREAKSESAEPSSGGADPPKQDYIHVRARRGQATDSHSLAERARREKISERMKILQDLVPGCNKVIGKALVLDEIINYIQSLQRQVEFLSMKLEAVNSRIPTGIEVFPSKDINMAPQFGQQTFEVAGMGFGSQAPREYNRGSSPDWLHMQVGGGFDRTT